MDITKILIRWYTINKRDLPWRNTHDPYRIWVSEIILQQTRIDQGLNYYLRFLENFPDLKTLAAGSEESVLKIWQGLGYYSRARNMHAAAKEIMRVHHGQFPVTYPEIRALKGIGDYTAAAVSSIAFGIPVPVVDGNVLRLFSRFFGLSDPVDTQKGKNVVLEKAKAWISPDHPGDFNQAIMEFGALQCKPTPMCNSCPLKSACVAFLENQVTMYPVKSKKPEPRTRYFHYFMITSGKEESLKVFIKQRRGNDIWKNLFDFPMIETNEALTFRQLQASAEWNQIFPGNHVTLLNTSKTYRHILTHQLIFAAFYHLEFAENIVLPFLQVNMDLIRTYPVPRLIEKYLEDQSIGQV